MDFKSYLKEQGLSKTTVESYFYHVLSFIAFLDKNNIEEQNYTEKEVMLYLNHLQKTGIVNVTKKIRLYALKHFFNYQIHHHKIIQYRRISYY